MVWFLLIVVPVVLLGLVSIGAAILTSRTRRPASEFKMP